MLWGNSLAELIGRPSTERKAEPMNIIAVGITDRNLMLVLCDRENQCEQSVNFSENSVRIPKFFG